MEPKNKTIVSEIVLKGLAGSPTSHIILFVILLLVFIITVTGNMLMIVVISIDYRLHSPMYFFLFCLSVMEICGIQSVSPYVLATLVKPFFTISWNECITQSYFYTLISTSDFLLLTVMSFDRFITICYPLQYATIMNNRLCVMFVVGCFFISFFSLLYPLLTILKLPLCGHVLDYFFCGSGVLLELICADISLLKIYSIISSVFILIIPLTITVISYICIVSTVIRLPSDTGRKKKFSTCLSHLTMVSVVYGGAIFIHVRPSRAYSKETDKIVNLTSTVLAPLLNPFIYTLRNQKVKESITDAIKQYRQVVNYNIRIRVA